MHHEQTVNFIIVMHVIVMSCKRLQLSPCLDRSLTYCHSCRCLKKDMWQSIVVELIFWKIKFNNSFNNTVQHTYVLFKHVVLEVRQYVPSQNHVMFHTINNAEIIALKFNHLLALLLRVNEPSFCVLFIFFCDSAFHSCNLSPHLRLTLVTQNSIQASIFIFTTAVHTLHCYDGSLESVHQIA